MQFIMNFPMTPLQLFTLLHVGLILIMFAVIALVDHLMQRRKKDSK